MCQIQSTEDETCTLPPGTLLTPLSLKFIYSLDRANHDALELFLAAFVNNSDPYPLREGVGN
jgi:hypothetical protein